MATLVTRTRLNVNVCSCISSVVTKFHNNNNYNNNIIYLLKFCCHPVAVFILHVYKIIKWLLIN